MKILLDISFLGTAYHGYQVQPDSPTIQAALNSAAKDLFGFDCDVVGCSRTDSGVHANQFFATVAKRNEIGIDTSIPAHKLITAFSVRLPQDISVNNAELVPDSFHARYDVKHKEYEYLIWNKPQRNPFMYDRSWHYPRYIDDVALKRMNDACSRFWGTHDFSSYMASNSSVKSTVRTVYDAQIMRDGDLLRFKVSADGFLYNMVRILTGTLIAVAEGKISPEDIDAITEARDRSMAGITVPPQGLYLNKVVYK